MTIEYQARLEDTIGRHLYTFENFVDPTDGGGAGLDYVLNVGKPAALLLTVPGSTNPDLFQIDNRILPMRSIHGRNFYNDNQSCYLIRKRYFTDSWMRITAYHANELLDRRGVLYNTGSAFANKAAAVAGNQIKAYVRENIGASISAADRDGVETLADLVTAGYLTIEANKGDGVSNVKTSDRGSLLGVIQDIADNSTQDGTYMSFSMLYGSDKTFFFVTRAGQWGQDKRAGMPSQVILSPERGNLENWSYEEDYSNEVTFAVAGGRGQNDERIIQTAFDSTRASISPFNRRERYFDAPGADATADVLVAAKAALRAGKPKISFTGDLIETPDATRGIHFDLGDIVTARVTVIRRPIQFDCRLDTIYVSIRGGSQKSRVDLTSPI